MLCIELQKSIHFLIAAAPGYGISTVLFEVAGRPAMFCLLAVNIVFEVMSWIISCTNEMDHLHKNQGKKKKTQDPYALGLWGHGNDLGDSQLENGKVTEDALFPFAEFPERLLCFVAEPGFCK